MDNKKYFARLAQLVEHIVDVDGVIGSNPIARTNLNFELPPRPKHPNF